MNQTKTYRLLFKNSRVVEVPRSFIDACQTLANLCDDIGLSGVNEIDLSAIGDSPLDYFDVHALAEYLEKIENATNLDDVQNAFFRRASDSNIIFKMISLANYLNCPSFVEPALKFVALELNALTPEEIRQKFNIPEDLE